MLQFCGEIHPEDGTDPREWFKKSRSSRKQDRKDLQLCRQIARVLSFVLPDCDDLTVQNMDVVGVSPNPDGSCVRVHIVCHDPSSIALANEALQNQKTRLQYEIARGINRKRVPNLVFDVSFAKGDCHGE